MSKQIFYKQCLLKRFYMVEGAEASQEITTWIPEKFAKQGDTLKLKMGEEWVDNWVVVTISDQRLEEKHLPDSHAQIKGHRKQTGDAMSK